MFGKSFECIMRHCNLFFMTCILFSLWIFEYFISCNFIGWYVHLTSELGTVETETKNREKKREREKMEESGRLAYALAEKVRITRLLSMSRIQDKIWTDLSCRTDNWDIRWLCYWTVCQVLTRIACLVTTFAWTPLLSPSVLELGAEPMSLVHTDFVDFAE